MSKKVILTRPPRTARGDGDKRPLSPPSKEGERERGSELVPRVPNSSAELAKIIEAVDKLKRVDQKALYDLLALRLQESSNKGRDLDMWAHAVHQALVAAIGTDGAGMPGPMVTKRLLAARSSWPYVEDFVEQTRLDELKVAERQAAYHFLAKLLVGRVRDIARNIDRALTARFVADQAHHIAAFVEASFPGYAGSDALRFLVRQLVEGQRA